MSSVITTIRDSANDLNRLADYMEKELPKKLRDAEIKAFFLVRHYEFPATFTTVQRDAIRNWESRVSSKIAGLSMTEYSRLREWLGAHRKSLNNLRDPYFEKKENKAKSMWDYRVVLDLRDELMKEKD